MIVQTAIDMTLLSVCRTLIDKYIQPLIDIRRRSNDLTTNTTSSSSSSSSLTAAAAAILFARPLIVGVHMDGDNNLSRSVKPRLHYFDMSWTCWLTRRTHNKLYNILVRQNVIDLS